MDFKSKNIINTASRATERNLGQFITLGFVSVKISNMESCQVATATSSKKNFHSVWSVCFPSFSSNKRVNSLGNEGVTSRVASTKSCLSSNDSLPEDRSHYYEQNILDRSDECPIDIPSPYIRRTLSGHSQSNYNNQHGMVLVPCRSASSISADSSS
jgi:hypothetical protein